MRRVAILAACLGLLAAPAWHRPRPTIQKLNEPVVQGVQYRGYGSTGALYTKEAYLLPAGAQMVKGRAAIEAFWKERLKDIQDVQCDAVDVKPLGRGVPARSALVRE